MPKYYPILQSSDSVETVWTLYNCYGDILGIFSLIHMEDGSSKPILSLYNPIPACDETIAINQIMERIK